MPRPTGPEIYDRPRFERYPSDRLIDCLRRVFPGFCLTALSWIRVEHEIKELVRVNDQQGSKEFNARYASMTSAQLVRLLRDLALIPAPPVDEFERIADELSPTSREVLAALLRLNATQQIRLVTRQGIADHTGISLNTCRRVIENHLSRVNPPVIQTKSGPSGGCWLTPEGARVAAAIDAPILPREARLQETPSIRRDRRA